MRSTTCACLFILVLCVSQSVAAERPQVPLACTDNGTQVSYFYLNTLDCDLMLSGTTVDVVSVWVITTPITKARFSIPDPPVGTIGAEAWNFPHSGDRTTGIELDLGGCSQSGAILLGTLTLVNTPLVISDCPEWRIDDGSEVDYCTGETGPGVSFYHFLLTPGQYCGICTSWQWCPTLPPENLYPPDGAVDVPLDVELTCFNGFFLRITDDPTCAAWQQFSCTGPFSPGFLKPATTYYWQLVEDLTGSGCSLGHDTHTAIQSFTTVGAIPVETNTWGAIKALYE